MDQINRERARIDRSGGPPLTISEHTEFLRALKLFTWQGRITDAGFGQIGQMVGRPASLMRSHFLATRAISEEAWPEEHLQELKQWRQSLPAPPTLADVLGLKQLSCGKYDKSGLLLSGLQGTHSQGDH